MIGKLESGLELPPNTTQSLNLALDAGNSSELIVSFQRPQTAALLSVAVMVDSVTGKGTQFLVDYVPNASTVAVRAIGTHGRLSDSLKLSPQDKTIDFRVFTDVVFSELYLMGGRVAMTMPSHCSTTCGMTVVADATGVTLASATAWKVSNIWVTPQEVLSTPRADTDGGGQRMAERIHAQQRGHTCT